MSGSDRKLIDYLPEALRDVREYKAVTDAEEGFVFGLYEKIQTALDNQFIATSDEYGLARREKPLGIVPKAAATLYERRAAVSARLTERLPYTYRSLEQTLIGLCGEGNYKSELDPGNYALTVLIAIPSGGVLGEVRDLLKRVCPANLALTVSIEYNRHSALAAYTHGILAAKTRCQLRNEVLQ